MRISVIVPSFDGRVPVSLEQACGGRDDVEIVVVGGVSPVGKARNEGLRRATGDWIAWVDSDDEVTEDWLKEIEAAIVSNEKSSNDVSAVIFDAKAVRWPCLGDMAYGKVGVLEAGEVVRDVYEDRRIQGHLWRTVTRRELWDGLRFDEAISAYEDFLLLPKVLERAHGVVCIPKSLYSYVRRDGSAVSCANMKRVTDGVNAAIRRWREASAVYRTSALTGSMKVVYESLQLLNVDLRGHDLDRETEAKVIEEGYDFLRKHQFELKIGFHERLRLVCACFRFWTPQRIAHRRRFRT